MPKQDLLIAVVSVSAIVYVILFDVSLGLLPPAAQPGVVAGPQVPGHPTSRVHVRSVQPAPWTTEAPAVAQIPRDAAAELGSPEGAAPAPAGPISGAPAGAEPAGATPQDAIAGAGVGAGRATDTRPGPVPDAIAGAGTAGTAGAGTAGGGAALAAAHHAHGHGHVAPIAPGSPAPSGLLVIGAEGGPTPQARARLVEDVRRWINRPIPGEFDRLRDEYEGISQVADSVALCRGALDDGLARVFADRLSELKRLYLLQRTTNQLAEVATAYPVPAASERELIQRELVRLRDLARDVEWVEQRYDFMYPKDRKEYLAQLIEVLESMSASHSLHTSGALRR
jgi:hypothetical protein